MKALLFTDDPWCPSGVIGLFETEEQKQSIIKEYGNSIRQRHQERLNTVKFPGWWATQVWENKEEAYNATVEIEVQKELYALKEIDIPIGVYGEYY